MLGLMLRSLEFLNYFWTRALSFSLCTVTACVHTHVKLHTVDSNPCLQGDFSLVGRSEIRSVISKIKEYYKKERMRCVSNQGFKAI